METIELDKKDKKILYELFKNSRESTTKIAKNVELSREVVNYRIRELEKKGVIEGYYTILDSYRLGYVIYRILLKFSSISTQKEKEIISELRQIPNISWIAELKGNWDIAVLIQSKTVHDFKNTYDIIMSKYSSLAIKKSTPIVLSIYTLIPNLITGTHDFNYVKVGEKPSNMLLDETDMKILDVLSNDARASLIDISKKVNYTPNGVQYKLKNLVKGGIILGYKPKINYNLFGYQNYKVFLYLEKNSSDTIGKIKRYLIQNAKTLYITESIGECDLEFEMLAKTTLELYDEINELRNFFEGIIRDFQVILTYYEHQINYLPH